MFLTRTLFSKGMMTGGLTNRVASIRNFNHFQPPSNLAPLLAAVSPSTQKSTQLISSRKSSTHGDHVSLWTAEKALSAALLPIIPAAFIFPSQIMDYALALTLTVHSHWGIEAIVVDYIRPSVFGALIPKLALGLLYVLSSLTLGGLCYFTYTDVGLVQAIKLLWKL